MYQYLIFISCLTYIKLFIIFYEIWLAKIRYTLPTNFLYFSLNNPMQSTYIHDTAFVVYTILVPR